MGLELHISDTKQNNYAAINEVITGINKLNTTNTNYLDTIINSETITEIQDKLVTSVTITSSNTFNLNNDTNYNYTIFTMSKNNEYFIYNDTNKYFYKLYNNQLSQYTIDQLLTINYIFYDNISNYLYAVSSLTNSLYRIDLYGSITTIVGTNTDNQSIKYADTSTILFEITNALNLNSPKSIICNNIGNIFLCDTNNNRILRLYNNNRNFVIQPLTISSTILKPSHIVYTNKDNNIYVFSEDNNKIYKLTKQNDINYLSIEYVSLAQPIIKLEVDVNDNIYYSYGNATITQIKKTKKEVTIQTDLIGNINDIKFNGNNTLHVLHQNKISQFEINISSGIPTQNTYVKSIPHKPTFMTFDTEFNNIYFSQENSIIKIELTTTKMVSNVTTFYSSKTLNPQGLVVDSNGYVYCINYYYNLIIKFNSSGLIVPFMSLADNNKLNKPIGLTIDSENNIYCTNYGNNTISKITTNGQITTYKTNIITPTGINYHYDNLDAKYYIYCCSHSTGKIIRIDVSTGNVEDYITGLINPIDVVHSAVFEDLFFTSSDNKIYKISTESKTVSVHVEELNNPIGLIVDSFNTLYCANYIGCEILKISTAQQYIYPNFLKPSFLNPLDIVNDKNNNLYCTHPTTQIITKITSDGIINKVIDFKVNDIDEFRNTIPYGIEIDKDNKNLYCIDIYNNTILKISIESDTYGNISKLINLQTQNINGSNCLKIGKSGHLFVSNKNNNTIMRITLTGEKTGAVKRYSANSMFNDNIINKPSGMIFDANNNLYVMHTNLNNNINYISIGNDNTAKKNLYNYVVFTSYFVGIPQELNIFTRCVMDTDENMFIVCNKTNEIKKLSKDINISTIKRDFTTYMMTGTNSSPYGICIDSDDNMYYTNYIDNSIVKITI